MAELQTIPARHGVATFVPAGHCIKIINTSGTQVISTWAIALPKPAEKEEQSSQQTADGEDQNPQRSNGQGKKEKKGDLPSQEEAEKRTKEGLKGADKKGSETKSTWSSYVKVPSMSGSKSKNDQDKQQGSESQQAKDSKTWASYFPTGKGFSSYIPSAASESVSAFASSPIHKHYRDTSKSYLEQLQDFSKTPVGAAGLAAVSGSGYTSSLYAGYQAYQHMATNVPSMEYLSMPHSREATKHLRPQVDDVLVSNVREPMLTLTEDTSPGIHDTLTAACDPQVYRKLGLDKWEEHGSCAENLVLALKELNERAGLKAAKAIGSQITMDTAPAPLHFFMNVPWTKEGEISFEKVKSGKEDFVKLRAERDVVVIMSGCPQDVTDINSRQTEDCHFVVEAQSQKEALQAAQPAKRGTPRKIRSYRAPSTVATGDLADDDKSRMGSDGKSNSTRKGPPQGDKARSRPMKKPIPAPVQPQQRSTQTTDTSKPEDKENDGGAVEKRKPRKLSAKPRTA